MKPTKMDAIRADARYGLTPTQAMALLSRYDALERRIKAREAQLAEMRREMLDGCGWFEISHTDLAAWFDELGIPKTEIAP